mgnify:CR=1 FL=1
MVRPHDPDQRAEVGSPHPRGDGPNVGHKQGHKIWFSPPAWGWSAPRGVRHRTRQVLPTRVGMVRARGGAGATEGSSPHPRGDGPFYGQNEGQPAPFSPPAWGWSDERGLSDQKRMVLPTRVGMVRVHSISTASSWRSPHPRGDGPTSGHFALPVTLFSPPAWGWSGDSYGHRPTSEVLPTRVGMVRGCPRQRRGNFCSPHPRGDGPEDIFNNTYQKPLSPPAWGWSVWPSRRHVGGCVLPTRVGMVRLPPPWRRPTSCSPHPRGDGPFL